MVLVKVTVCVFFRKKPRLCQWSSCLAHGKKLAVFQGSDTVAFWGPISCRQVSACRRHWSTSATASVACGNPASAIMGTVTKQVETSPEVGRAWLDHCLASPHLTHVCALGDVPPWYSHVGEAFQCLERTMQKAAMQSGDSMRCQNLVNMWQKCDKKYVCVVGSSGARLGPFFPAAGSGHAWCV